MEETIGLKVSDQLSADRATIGQHNQMSYIMLEKYSVTLYLPWYHFETEFQSAIKVWYGRNFKSKWDDTTNHTETKALMHDLMQQWDRWLGAQIRSSVGTLILTEIAQGVKGLFFACWAVEREESPVKKCAVNACEPLQGRRENRQPQPAATYTHKPPQHPLESVSMWNDSSELNSLRCRTTNRNGLNCVLAQQAGFFWDFWRIVTTTPPCLGASDASWSVFQWRTSSPERAVITSDTHFKKALNTQSCVYINTEEQCMFTPFKKSFDIFCF